ncbi:MAG: prefoldin subunit alpha, partial [archaeon]|nr:prefoldin subunit alpha [archaeon]
PKKKSEPKMEEAKKTTVKLTGPQVAQLASQEQRKLEDITARLQKFQDFRNDLRGAKDALDEIGKSEKGAKILVDLGAGILVEAKLEDNSKAISALAGNVFRKKSGKEIKDFLDKKIKNMDLTIEKTVEEHQKTATRLTQLENILEAGKRQLQARQ